MGVHALAVAPSNPATDNLASAVERRASEMGTIRFHSYDSEIRAVCRRKLLKLPRFLLHQHEETPLSKLVTSNPGTRCSQTLSER